MESGVKTKKKGFKEKTERNSSFQSPFLKSAIETFQYC